MHISGLMQFIAVLFKGQLYNCRNRTGAVKKMSETFEVLEMFCIFSRLVCICIYVGVCVSQSPQNCELKIIVFNCKQIIPWYI